MDYDKRCPTCDSPHSHLHPAMQEGGEVEVCRYSFHRRITPQNTAARILAAGLEPLGE